MNDADRLAQVGRARRVLADATTKERLARARLEAAIVRAAETGATQRAIAAKAGVSQPYVSQVLAQRRGRFVPETTLGYRLAAHRDDVLRIAKEHGLTDIKVFGSVARGDDDDDSDIDLMADLPSGMGLIGLGRAETALAEALGVAVDLVPARSLKAHVRESAQEEAVPL